MAKCSVLAQLSVLVDLKHFSVTSIMLYKRVVTGVIFYSWLQVLFYMLLY